MNESVKAHPGTAPLYLEDIQSYGVSSGQGNLVGVQSYMTVTDYATATNYYAKLAGYLEVARQENWLNPKSIVVFPEYIGTWLVATGEHEAVFQADTLEKAMKQMLLRRLGRFLLTLPHTKGKDRIVDALFRLKAKEMARLYQETFAALAREFEVTIVAGSLILPEPTVVDGRLSPGSGPLQNVGLVFTAAGLPYPKIVRKVYPTNDEAPFVQAAPAAELPVYDTPAGRLGALICADSWYPAVYEALAAQRPQLLVVGNNQTPAGCWTQPWPGYNPGPMPADVDPQDVGQLTEGEAWLKYALAGRLSSAGAAAGMLVFSHGELWDVSGDGHMIIVNETEVIEASHVARAALVNVWL